jgi:hypothetical protein
MIIILGHKDRKEGQELDPFDDDSHYVDGRFLRFSNCYYYHCDFDGLGATHSK